MHHRIIVVTATLLFASFAHATLVVPVPLERMAKESAVIVMARVHDQQIVWSKDGQRILTLTQIEVLEDIRGAKVGEFFTIYQVGGRLDGIVFDIPGALQFHPGEEMVLFAQPFDGMLVSYGMGLGKYRVIDGNNGRVVSPEYGDVGFVKLTAGGKLEPATPPEGSEPVLLKVFLQRVRDAIGGAP